MKRLRCPKCDNYITFDETRYAEGQTLVFQCPQCQRQFAIRIGTAKLMDTRKQERQTNAQDPDADITTGLAQNQHEQQQDCGALIVIENVFHFKQTLPLQLGDNVIGRYVRGTDINTPIETVDPSVDTTHCIINVRQNPTGQFIYTIRDASTDGTGTFVGTTMLREKDRRRIDDGTIITIGATTMILRAAGAQDEETTAEDKH